MGSKKSSGKNNSDRAGKPLLLLAPNSTTALNESMPIAKRLSGTKRKSDSVPAVTPTPKKTQSIITQPAPVPAATYNRKAKSLSLLCQNFCSQDWSQGICINDAALMFGVERRRIYDIVNILDSLGVVKRICKNKYEWLGFENVPRVLGEFQSEDLDPAPNEKKTLGMLCKQFLQLFLKGNETLCLYEASNIIMGPPDSAKSMKTKVRRLYDIANIFMSLRLITKLDEDVRKAKPVFKWAYEMDSDQIRAGFNGQSISPELKGESVVSKAIGVNRVVGVSVSNEQKDESMQIVITPLKRVSEKRGVPASSTSVLSSPEQIQIKAGPEIDGNSSSIEAPIRAVTLETEPCSPAQEKHLFERIHETGADFAAATPAK